MVEKAGHSRRMQVMRRAWLDDTKPKPRELTPAPGDMQISDANGSQEGRGDYYENSLPGQTVVEPNAERETGQDESAGPDPGHDELDDLLAQNASGNVPQKTDARRRRTGPFEEDDRTDEDELDALLSENPTTASALPTTNLARRGPVEDDPDDDELDALMLECTSQASTSGLGKHSVDDFADDEEAMASMGGML